MRERGITFTSEMVQAVMAGRKTQTRRLGGLKLINEAPDDWELVNYDEDSLCRTYGKGTFAEFFPRGRGEPAFLRCRYGCPGDRLYVQEAWAAKIEFDDVRPSLLSGSPFMWYKSNGAGPVRRLAVRGRWRSGRFMPKWAARTWCEVVRVWPERIQDISRDDVFAEGVPETFGEWITPPKMEPHEWDNMTWLEQWQWLWDAINGKRGYGFDRNNWVWVVEFKVAEGKK